MKFTGSHTFLILHLGLGLGLELSIRFQ